MSTYIEKHTVVTKDTLNVDHNSRETFQHVKFMNPENIYMGTFTSKGYKFEDLVSHSIYDVVLSGGYAVISGDNNEVAIVNADQIKDILDERTVSSYGAIPSLPLISALNDAINKRITQLDDSAAKLSGNNDISGYNSIEELNASNLSAAYSAISSLVVADGLSAATLSVQSLNDISADGETLSSVLSNIGADVEALEDEMHKADLSIVLKLNDAVDNLIDRENTISAQLSDEVIQLSTNLSTDIDSLSAALSDEIQILNGQLSDEVEQLSNSLSNEVIQLSTSLSDDIDTISVYLSTDYVDKIENALTSANNYTDTVSAMLSTDILNVSVAADATPADGYLKTYTIAQGGIERGKINIPKDFLVKSGSVKTVVEPDEPYEGAKVGDKYIDLVINSKDSELQTEGEHLYIPANSLVDIYEGYSGICITTNVDGNIISADINVNSISKDKLSSDVISSLDLADSALQLSDIDDISADTDDKAASTRSVYENVGVLSAAISEKRGYFDLSYNTTNVVHEPIWELSYMSQQGVIDDTATLYTVERGSSGGYDYEKWSGTSKKNSQVQFTLLGHSIGAHAGTWNWGTAQGNIGSISLDTTEFSVGKLAGTKVSEYEVENKDYLALKSELGKIVYAECTSDQSAKDKIATTAAGDFIPEVGSIVAVHFSSYCTDNQPTLSIDKSDDKRIYTKLYSDGTKVNAGEWAWGDGDIVLMRMFDWGWLVIGATKADPNQFGLVRLKNGLYDDDPNAAVNQRAIKTALDEAKMPMWYPNGAVKHPSEWTPIWDGTTGLKYKFDEQSHTAAVYPFAGSGENTNIHLTGRVVIPPYVVKNGQKYEIVGILQGTGPFSTSTNLTEIVAPMTIIDVGSNAFDGCQGLVNVYIPGKVTINDYAFSNCTSLERVIFPNATTIGHSSFYLCSSLVDVDLISVKTFDQFSFNACTGLKAISLPSATSLGVESIFLDCTSLREVHLPKVESLGNWTFNGCSALEVVDFGDTVREQVPTIGAGSFANVPNTCTIVIPDKQYDAWIAAPNWTTLVEADYKFLRFSEWKHHRILELGTAVDDLQTAVSNKRSLTDLNVYEEKTVSYWQTEDIQIPLVSESGMSKIYSNGETEGSYRVNVDDFRSIGGMFRVYVYKHVSGQWTQLSTSPTTSFQEITHVEQTAGGSSKFDYISSSELSLAGELLVTETKVTWAELIAMKNNDMLKPGQCYRITDYVATTAQSDTRSAGKQFDIIVTADDERTLNEHARAIQHEGDIYFAGCSLAAWDVWYCIDNDTTRFAWADTTNGKGVVYRLVDEFQNDCPYDFKGLQFNAYGDNDNIYRYTFDSGASPQDNNEDYSIVRNKNVFGNKILPYRNSDKKLALNKIVFKNKNCNSNVFGAGCYSNTFGENCNSNVFGAGCYEIKFKGNCFCNSLGQLSHNINFANSCEGNTFGESCYGINLNGNECKYITFGNNCGAITLNGEKCNTISFGNYCNTIWVGAGTENCTFGNRCYNIYFGLNNGSTITTVNYYRNITVENGVHHVELNCTTSSSISYYKNVTIKSGIAGSEGNLKPITDARSNQNYHTTYQPANSMVISV